ESASGSSADTASETAEDPLLATAEDYDEIYKYVQAETEYWNDSSYGVEESALDGAGSADSSSAPSYDAAAASGARNTSGAASGAEYSDTNVREEGVGEGDIVKTDGKNIYIVSGAQIHIVGTDK